MCVSLQVNVLCIVILILVAAGLISIFISNQSWDENGIEEL